jgi:translation initiation factor IF-3
VKEQYSLQNKNKKENIRMNSDISAKTVRVVDEEGNQLGIMSIEDALLQAESSDKDLIEISPEANPPVVKIIDYGKWRYNKIKSEQKNTKERKTTKEVRFSISISENDLNTKLKMVEKFLKQGDNVLVKVILKGRERIREQLGKEKIEKIVTIVKPIAKSVGEIKIEKNVIQCLFFS